MSGPKVSIIVPVFNQEKYIEKSITSLCMQTYRNIEIIAVNDGSTDSSLDILYEFRCKDNRILVVDKVNGGLVDAVSCGIDNASGDFLAFVDPDDYVGVNYIQDLIELTDDITEMAAAGIYTEEIRDGISIDKRTVFLEADEVYSDEKLSRLREDFFWDKNRAVLWQPILQSRCNKIYRKAVIDNVVKTYREYKNAIIGEDTLFNFLALQNCRAIRTKSAPVEYYYCLRNDSSMTRSSDSAFSYRCISMVQKLEKAGMPLDKIMIIAVVKGLTKDTINMLANNITNDNKYSQSLRKANKKLMSA